MENQKKNVFITAPHVCINNNEHNHNDPGCDRYSKYYAQQMKQSFPKSRRKNVHLFLSRTLRNECDNNRIQCRQTPMRKRLRKSMEKYEGDFIGIDIHTFESGDNFQLIEKYFGIVEVVVMDTHRTKLVETLLHFLHKAAINAYFIVGSEMNDIQYEAKTKFSGKVILLEIRQQLSKEKLRTIGRVISKLI